MHSKSSLLDELVKRVNRNVQADHTDIEDDNGDYTSDEEEFNDGLPKWIKLHETFVHSLFILKKIFYYAYFNFIMKLEARQNFLF